MPAVVSSTERSSGGGTSEAEGTLRWSRSSKNDRKRARISAAFTGREGRGLPGGGGVVGGRRGPIYLLPPSRQKERVGWTGGAGPQRPPPPGRSQCPHE